jgi:glycosyltransferase involved in cell wall biosynthesis
VQLLGQRRDVIDLLAAADVFVMPSRREGLSYAVLEALGHGVATVVSNAPGNPEAVGDAGLVFPAGDEARLAAVLLELASDPERRAALATAGRERVATELSAEQMLRGTRAVYESILKAPARRVAEAHA